ncbi:MAG: cell division protein CrgA [Acidimicrobiia bacterium]|nr:cell division protein CrgA [Acidimicrobiia bacterium]
MASGDRPAPTRRTGGGGRRPGKKATVDQRGGPAPSTRYTPPGASGRPPSPRWVPISMVVFFVIGLLVIFLHYVDAVLPGALSNWWLLGGLGFILAGIVTATQYR